MVDIVTELRGRLTGAQERIAQLEAQVRTERALRADADAEIRRHHIDFARWEEGWAKGAALQARVRVMQSELHESLPFLSLATEQRDYRLSEMRAALAGALAASEHVRFELLEGPSLYGCRLRMYVELLAQEDEPPTASLVMAPTVAAGTVAEGLVRALQVLIEKYGAAGVANAAAELADR